MSDVFYTAVIPITDKNREILTDMALRNMGPCELCGHEICYTACLICGTQVCEKHCANPEEEGMLRCVNCVGRKWDGVKMTLAELRERKKK